jgi:hypothetical protein
MGKHSGLFRVRRGLFGRSVLQELIDYPGRIGPHVDSSIRELRWVDVPYSEAPRALVSQFCEEIMSKFTDGIRRRR